METGLQFKLHILDLLRLRNAQQCAAFRALFDSYSRMLKRSAALYSKNNELIAEVSTLRVANVQLHSETGLTSGGPSRAELEQQLHRLQVELTVSYKRNSENTQAVLDAAKLLKENEVIRNNLLQDKEAQAKEHRKLQEKHELLQREKQALEQTLHLLKEEHTSTKVELVKYEEALASLRREHEELLTRWIKLKNEEVEKMNEANKFYEELKEQSARADLMSKVDKDMLPLLKGVDPNAVASAPASRTIPTSVLRTIEAHKGEINALVYSPNGGSIATGSNDKLVKLWDARSGNIRTTLSGQVQSVMCVTFSPNNEFVLGASNDASVRIWSTTHGRARHTLTGHIGKVFAAAFTDDSYKVVTGSHDRTLKIWDLSKGYCIRTIFCYSSCNDLCLSLNSNLICSGHLDNTLRFWDANNGDCAFELTNIHGKQVTCVRLSPDGRCILTASRDNLLRLVDLRTHGVLETYKDANYKSGVNWNKVCFSPDGRFVAAGSATGEVYVWNVASSKVEAILKDAHDQRTISAVSWNPLGHQLASCDRGGYFVIWE